MFLICAYDRQRHLATGGCLYVCFSMARPTSTGIMILGWPSEHLEIDDLEVGNGRGELGMGSWEWGAGNGEPDCSVTTGSPESPDIFILGPNHLSDPL